MSEWPKAAISLFPVLGFVLGLVLMDGYKLTPWRMLGACFLAGLASAGLSLGIYRSLFFLFPGVESQYPRYIAPVIEELTKGTFLYWLFRRKKIGFLVDATIYGALIGAGFAFLENIFYLLTWSEKNLLLWAVRGFGTALMHSGMTALAAVLTIDLLELRQYRLPAALLSGLAVAALLHSLFNHFVLAPVTATLVLLLVVPPVILVAFTRSEAKLKSWLRESFDSDVALLDIICGGQVRNSRIGDYLQTLKEHFPGEMLADMVCYVRVHAELSLKAKGLLFFKENGLPLPQDPEVSDLFEELYALKKNLGYAGCLAVAPILQQTDRDLWQLHLFRSAKP